MKPVRSVRLNEHTIGVVQVMMARNSMSFTSALEMIIGNYAYTYGIKPTYERETEGAKGSGSAVPCGTGA